MIDYSEYLNKPGMLEYIEQEWLEKAQHIHDYQAAFVFKAWDNLRPRSIIEFGCSTGNLAKRLAKYPVIKYRGIDSNERALDIARQKVPGYEFINADIRTYSGKADLIVCYATFKHFSLDELPKIAARLRKLGKYMIFDMPYSEQPKDDGVEHHHTWAPLSFFGFEAIDTDTISNPIEPIYLV